MDIAVKVALLGIFATIAIDTWATFSNKALNLPRTDWAMVGRWLSHIPTGKLVHNSIRSTSQANHEKLLGWTFHYCIGIVYAALYTMIVLLILDGQPSLASAWVFGMATILSPWLIMQPCLGMGFCATKAAHPNKVRLQNLAIHSIFGTALYYGWL